MWNVRENELTARNVVSGSVMQSSAVCQSARSAVRVVSAETMPLPAIGFARTMGVLTREMDFTEWGQA